MNNWQNLLALWLSAVNLIALLLMWADKYAAQRHACRVSERALFLFPLLGGSLGGLLGMYAFRHKTKHWYFRLGFPALLLLHLALLFLLFRPLP